MNVAEDRPDLRGLTFSERLAALGIGQKPAAAPRNTGTVVQFRTGTDGGTPYGSKALDGLCADIAAAGVSGGRDDTFNRACLRAGELIRRGDLTRDTAESALRAAGLAVTDDHDFTAYKVEEKLGRVIEQGVQASYETKRATLDPIPTLRTFEPTAAEIEMEQQAADAAAEFWQARPVLDHVRTFARSRMTSPWAVLGVALCRVVVTARPHLVLPPTVGSHASLNLFVALVGESGGGKGAAESAAADCLTLDEDVHTATVGSGEGIGHLYAHRERGEVVRDRDAVLFTIPEVDNLTALGSRQGATLMPQLRSAWSGEALGFSYADKNKALPLPRHSYRMGLILGVQPGRAATLLDDADGGTPQRFVWLPTTDPDAPDQLPATPAPWPVRRNRGPVVSNGNGLASMTVTPIAVETIVEARRARLRGDGEALDGHLLLCRLKTAAALALLDGRVDVNEQDWHLSGLVTTVSVSTRQRVVRHLASVAAQSNQAKGIGEAMRAVTVSEHVEAAAVQRTGRAIAKRLQAATDEDGWVPRGRLRGDLSKPQREHFEAALTALMDAGQVTASDGTTTRYKWTERPAT